MRQGKAQESQDIACKKKILEAILDMLRSIESAASLRRIYNLAVRLSKKETG
ncbi:MAG: hypothetical protein VB099_16515 [Candidatus Limiplasma sp.]|nr:hypothetical protein [Candidatus Limiplasma sp.]